MPIKATHKHTLGCYHVYHLVPIKSSFSPYRPPRSPWQLTGCLWGILSIAQKQIPALSGGGRRYLVLLSCLVLFHHKPANLPKLFERRGMSFPPCAGSGRWSNQARPSSTSSCWKRSGHTAKSLLNWEILSGSFALFISLENITWSESRDWAQSPLDSTRAPRARGPLISLRLISNIQHTKHFEMFVSESSLKAADSLRRRFHWACRSRVAAAADGRTAFTASTLLIALKGHHMIPAAGRSTKGSYPVWEVVNSGGITWAN